MEKKALDFLFELLSTPSPSSHEQEIQKKWADYVRGSAHKLETDMSGNVIGIINPDAKFKVLLTGHCDEIGFIINRIDDRGYLHFEKLGGISHKLAPGMKVEVLGYGKRITGVVGANAQHHGGLKEGFDFEDLYIDCGAESREQMEQYVRFGDLAIYKRETELLLNDRISGKALDNKTGAFIVAEVLRRVAEKDPRIGVYCASTVAEECGVQGAYSVGAYYNPDLAIAIDVTFATDHPGVNTAKYGEVFLGKGPVLGIGVPINTKAKELLEKAAENLDMKLQYELYTRATGTDADKIKYTGRGVPIALLSLPIRYMHSPVETASLRDIDAEIDLLVEMLLSMTGEEKLNPFEI